MFFANSPTIRFLFLRALTAITFGAISSAVLIFLAGELPVVAAARDAILNAQLAARAYTREFPKEFARLTMIGIDKTACEPQTTNIAGKCRQSAVINRRVLAELTKAAATAAPKVIVIDVGALASQGCDEQTRELVDTILAVSHNSPIVMARELRFVNDVYEVGPTFFDECYDALPPEARQRLLAGDGVFFGHALISPSEDRGAFDAIKPWTPVSFVDPKQGSWGVRRLPALSLVAALAIHSGPHLLETLLASGLEARLETDDALGMVKPKNLSYCALAKSCSMLVTPLAAPPPARRISFQYGFGTGARISVMSEPAFTFVLASEIVPSSGLPPDSADAVIIAPTAEMYRDVHQTAIGPQPGGSMHANAIFDFLADSFLKAADPGAAFFLDLIIMLGFVTATVLLTLLVAKAMYFFWHREIPFIRMVVVSWPLMLAFSSVLQIYVAWRFLNDDFAAGSLSYGVFGLLLGLADLRGSVEKGWDAMLETGAEWLISSGVKPSRGQEDRNKEV